MSIIIPITFIFGAAIGSFLNVVILRYPGKVTGRSQCPHCGRQLSAPELLPILSYVFLFGRCAKCSNNISAQYPLVELCVGATAAWLGYRVVTGSTNPINAVMDFLIVTLLVVLFVIDLRTFILPDIFIVPLTVLAIIKYWLNPTALYLPLLGAFIGSGFLFFLWWLTARRGIGLGDVKLMVPLGLLFGPVNTTLLLFVSFILGGAFSILLLVSKKATLKTAVPFGPFLAGVGIIFLLFPKIPEGLLALIL